MVMRILFFVAWTLVTILLGACGSSLEKRAVDASSQQVRTTSPCGLYRLRRGRPSQFVYSGDIVPPSSRPASLAIMQAILPRRG